MNKERPIIMQAESVRTILAGTKTQTRRVIKPQPDENLNWITKRGKVVAGVLASTENGLMKLMPSHCPYGQVGDHLWVREAWRPAVSICQYVDGDEKVDTSINWGTDNLYYRADQDDCYAATRWRPPIHMPRWASRITLEITGVRVERLQAISEEDAQAEGVSIEDTRTLTYRGAFAITWDAINKKRGYGWEGGTNPWVWVIEFRRVQP